MEAGIREAAEDIPAEGVDIRPEAEDRRAVGSLVGRIAAEKIADLNLRMILNF